MMTCLRGNKGSKTKMKVTWKLFFFSCCCLTSTYFWRGLWSLAPRCLKAHDKNCRTLLKKDVFLLQILGLMNDSEIFRIFSFRFSVRSFCCPQINNWEVLRYVYFLLNYISGLQLSFMYWVELSDQPPLDVGTKCTLLGTQFGQFFSAPAFTAASLLNSKS